MTSVPATPAEHSATMPDGVASDACKAAMAVSNSASVDMKLSFSGAVLGGVLPAQYHLLFGGWALKRSYPLNSRKPWPWRLPLTLTGPSQ
jgi:hypothetical protein